jgi:hypothetical protein
VVGSGGERRGEEGRGGERRGEERRGGERSGGECTHLHQPVIVHERLYLPHFFYTASRPLYTAFYLRYTIHPLLPTIHHLLPTIHHLLTTIYPLLTTLPPFNTITSAYLVGNQQIHAKVSLVLHDTQRGRVLQVLRYH